MFITKKTLLGAAVVGSVASLAVAQHVFADDVKVATSQPQFELIENKTLNHAREYYADQLKHSSVPKEVVESALSMMRAGRTTETVSKAYDAAVQHELDTYAEIRAAEQAEKDKLEAEKKAEEERIAAEEAAAEKAEEERIANEKKEAEERQAQLEAQSVYSNAQVSLAQFLMQGVVYSGGFKFTYYSQSVLPGGGLQIPGRHVNAAGYVSDGDGYIVLAGSAPIGTVYDTPFGFKGKIYDRGTYGNHLDVYIR
jgi:hypothetical protein